MAITVSKNTPSVDAVDDSPTLTALMAIEGAMTKKYVVGDDGQVKGIPYQNALVFKSAAFKVGNITNLGKLIRRLSKRQQLCLIRGVAKENHIKRTWRTKDIFPEHPEGTPWVMLDIDGVEVPSEIDVLSVEAIKWLIHEKLPAEFKTATCYYQFSSSAGILNMAGAPLKTGLRVHLFFMLNRRVKGSHLAAYLKGYCIETGFYNLYANAGGVATMKYGIDPAPIISAIQPHYVALPIIDAKVSCSLTHSRRDGWIDGSTEVVSLPDIPMDIVQTVASQHKALRTNWQRDNGYTHHKKRVQMPIGIATVEWYSPTQSSSSIQFGRILDKTELLNKNVLRMYFKDEGTPGSWYVLKTQPHIARRYGDGEVIALQELSEGAYEFVKNTLIWFSDVPYQKLTLNDAGYIPTITSFVNVKHSLILAPTGTGKTTAVVNWMQHYATSQLVIYVAQTIPLVNQMRDDLNLAGLECHYYQGFDYNNPPQAGIFVTTNESMPKIISALDWRMTPYRLIVDEIHIAIDDFTRSNRKLEKFWAAVSKSQSNLFMTGTFTETQQLMLESGIAKISGGQLTQGQYCCYEFAPVKRNPLYICKSSSFSNDIVSLFQAYQEKANSGEQIPRTLILLSTSKMERYRILADKHGLNEYICIVSRPENDQEEIEEARLGDEPILVSSPLFAVGLNLASQPQLLLCNFDYVDVDTSKIVQTVNRVNRSDVHCEVRVYVSGLDDKEFVFPRKQAIHKSLTSMLDDETSLKNNHFDMPMMIDRLTYAEYRKVERDTNKALSYLIRNDAFQNYAITEQVEQAAVDKDKVEIYKDAKKAARAVYDDNVIKRLPSMGSVDVPVLFFRLRELSEEKRNKWRECDRDLRRTDRAIEEDELAVIMHLCTLTEPSKARQVSKIKLRVLFGDQPPWLSDRFKAEHFCSWASAAAQKTAELIPLVMVLMDFANKKIDVSKFLTKLNQDKTIKSAFKALATDDNDYITTERRFTKLAELREELRKNTSSANKIQCFNYGLKFLTELLVPLGVTFPTKDTSGGKRIDHNNPILPKWNFEEMIKRLHHRKALLEALPTEYTYVNREFDPKGDYAYPLSICQLCRFFDAASCALGRRIDYSEIGLEFWENDTPEILNSCDKFRGIRVKQKA